MITIQFDPKPLIEQAKATREQIRAGIARLLDYAGREAVNKERDLKAPVSYLDQSGNLRSSVGYVVNADGQELYMGGFEPLQGPKPQSDSLTPEAAAETGKSMAKAEAAAQPSYPVLTVVAGMNYASYVADKGRDVLSTARIVAEEIVRKGLEDLAI